MNRRSFLVGFAVVAASAGCLGGDSGEPSPTPAESPTPTETPTPVPPPEPTVESDFTVTDRSCGTGENAASISFEDGSVTVDGTIRGSNTCDTAVLDSIEWPDDTLTIRVKATQMKTTETVACGQCITDIRYTAELSIDGPLPDRVKVVHDTSTGTETVATATR